MNATRSFVPALLASAGLAGLLALGATGTADAGVQKCVGNDGAVSYTDGACGAAGAPVALPAGLARAVIASETGNFGYDMDGSAGAPVGLGPRKTSSGCARSPEQLQADIGYAFASRDINRIAGNYHWVGMGHKDARLILDRLEGMARERVSRSQYLNAGLGSAFETGSADSAGFLQLAMSGGSPVQMRVTRYQGCYFARF